MRFLEQIMHPYFTIQIFHWNGKYILKIEWSLFEQVFKISDQENAALQKLKSNINPNFLQKCKERFAQMQANFDKNTLE